MDSFAVDFLIGGGTAAVSKTITAPLEFAKLLLQNQSESKTITRKYTGLSDVMRSVYKEQGVRAFWQGNLTNVIRYFPAQALNFAFKDKFKHIFATRPEAGFVPHLVGNTLSGGFAGATSLLCVYPLDLARTRLGTDIVSGSTERKFRGLGHCLTWCYRHGGFAALYRGFGISVLGIFIYRGLYFGLYDTSKSLLPESSLLTRLVLSFGVTTTAGLLAYPVDTVRRRIMMTVGGKAYGSAWEATKTVAREGALFKGAFVNIVRGTGCALVLVGVDEVEKLVGRTHTY
ncbi:MAG: hypothetical protein MHM6MM_004622 [Cercozoa sp. M6MM]